MCAYPACTSNICKWTVLSCTSNIKKSTSLVSSVGKYSVKILNFLPGSRLVKTKYFARVTFTKLSSVNCSNQQ